MGAATAVTVEQALADIAYGGLAKIRGTVLAISVVQELVQISATGSKRQQKVQNSDSLKRS